MTDQEIVEHLKDGNSTVLKHVYVHLELIETFVIKNSGSIHDARDLFQDAVMVFYKNVVKHDFVLSSAISTYLYGIARRMWLNQLRDKKKIVDHLDHGEVSSVSAFDFKLENEPGELADRIEGIVNDMGETCRAILHMFYFQKLSQDQIRDKLSYNSSQVVRQQKYRCLKKIKEILAEKKLTQN